MTNTDRVTSKVIRIPEGAILEKVLTFNEYPFYQQFIYDICGGEDYFIIWFYKNIPIFSYVQDVDCADELKKEEVYDQKRTLRVLYLIECGYELIDINKANRPYAEKEVYDEFMNCEKQNGFIFMVDDHLQF